MKRILVPTDFSEQAENALKVAAQLAKKNESEIYYKINEIAKADDVVIFLGAGNITQFSDTIISKINNLGVNND